MQTIDAFCHRLASYLPPVQVQQVRRAYYYSEQAHDGQTRRSGEPYVTHPLAVAGILAEQKLDHHSLIAALLHDVIEDTGISKNALAEQFGDTVADLVDGVSKLTQIEFTSKAEAQAENFQKMAMAMTKDIRVILVKLADRLHNMRTLGVLKPEKRRRDEGGEAPRRVREAATAIALEHAQNLLQELRPALEKAIIESVNEALALEVGASSQVSG